MVFLHNSITWILVHLAPLVGFLGLFLAAKILHDLKTRDAGDSLMQAVAVKIREGSFLFLRTEYRVTTVFVAVIAALLAIIPTFGFETALCFLVGAVLSALAGYRGMDAATVSNLRAAQGARSGVSDALGIAFGGAAVHGLTTSSLGLLGIGVLFWFFGSVDGIRPLLGMSLGASSVAIFLRLSGGGVSKALDVGSDLVGKVEAGTADENSLNPGVIADLVGDNVGGIAGQGSDLFDSYVGAAVATMLLASMLSPEQVAQLSLFEHKPLTIQNFQLGLMGTPLVLAMVGLVGSIVGINLVQTGHMSDPRRAMRRGTIVSVATFLALSAVYFVLSNLHFWLLVPVAAGALCGIAIGGMMDFFTSQKPVAVVAESSRAGAATNIIAGMAIGYQSVALPAIGIAITIVVASWGGGLYGVGIAAVAMLATMAMTMSVGAFGAIADNARGIAEFAGLPAEVRQVADGLDSLGNATAAIGKGSAIGSATMTALTFFACYSVVLGGSVLSLSNPMVIAGCMLGAALPVAVAAMTISSVGRAATQVVGEIQAQFLRNPELSVPSGGQDALIRLIPSMESGRCVALATRLALQETALPAVLAVATPLAVGFLMGREALGGLQVGCLLTGVILALFMTNAGGAWDNAKKLVESGVFPGDGKGSDLHKATVIGDTVGDPLKDTAGPAMNILMKLVSIVSLVIAPLL